MVMGLTQISRIFRLYRGSQFYWWKKPENTTDLSQGTDKFYHIKLYQVHLAMSGIQTPNFSGDSHWSPPHDNWVSNGNTYKQTIKTYTDSLSIDVYGPLKNLFMFLCLSLSVLAELPCVWLYYTTLWSLYSI
jgi:hypothetical protein